MAWGGMSWEGVCKGGGLGGSLKVDKRLPKEWSSQVRVHGCRHALGAGLVEQ